MSFNLNTKINNLQWQINQIVAGSVTNPLSTALNANNKQITNINSLSSVSGSPLNLTAGASTVNIASAVNMVDTLTINNNTVHNGLVVKDSAGDSSCFVVDQSGNVGVKVDPASTLTTDFTVNGNTSISGNLSISGTFSGAGVVSNITAGTGILKTGTSSNPTISNSGVLTVGAGSSGISITGTAQNPVINNTGVLTVGAGSGVAVGGTSTNPTVSLTNVGTAGTYGYPTSVITDATGRITSITAGSPPASVSVPKLSRLGISGGSTSPINGGTTGYQSVSFISGAFYNDILAGTSPDPNGVWVLDFTPVGLLLTGSVNTGVVNIGFGNSADAGIYYNSGSNVATFGSLPTTNGSVPRTGSCSPFIVKVSDLIATCPNMSSGLTRLYFNNQSTDVLWVQTLPSAVNCYYYPNGVQ